MSKPATFDEAVCQIRNRNPQMARIDAVYAAGRQYPDLHAAWLAEQQPTQHLREMVQQHYGK